MFQHMFTSMNEMLDGIMEHYPSATEQERRAYNEQLTSLKKTSDEFIEHWLEFEQKYADFKDLYVGQEGTEHVKPHPDPSSGGESKAEVVPPAAEKASCNEADLFIPGEAAEMINKGQGYYKLFMFSQAAPFFQTAIAVAPECNLARLFLGMSQMHLQNWNEAQRQFQLLVVLSDFPKWLALGYNALGCIQAVRMNMAQAEKLFQKAYDVYPGFTDSLNNLKSCQEAPGQLSLYFGSTELCCL